MRADEAAGLPYRAAVVALLLNREGKAFVGRRADVATPEGAWQLPQGGIDAGESPGETVRRELAEEIGTDRFEIVAEGEGWHVYDLPPSLVGRAWKGRYRGQRLKCFLLRYTGGDGDVNVALGPRPEFSDWKWVDVARLPELVVAFKRPLYEALVAEFSPLAGPAAQAAATPGTREP